MQETKPTFLIRKYRRILWAAIIVEAVSFIISLTDSVVAGNILGTDALAAIGCMSPFLSFSTFMASIINSGTTMNFSYHVGRFEKRRALEFFSQGVYLALVFGALYSGILFVLLHLILPFLPAQNVVLEYALKYLRIMLLYYFMEPISCPHPDPVKEAGAFMASGSLRTVSATVREATNYRSYVIMFTWTESIHMKCQCV